VEGEEKKIKPIATEPGQNQNVKRETLSGTPCLISLSQLLAK
jgi:hypothetical protein